MNRFWARLTTFALIIVTGCLYATSVRATDYTHQDSLADTDNAGDLGQTNGAEKFVVRRVGGDRYFDVYVHGKRLFTVKERKIAGDSGQPASYVDDYTHDFYLSPDHRYLLTQQKTMHCFDAVTLYGPICGGHHGAILTKGLQFDDAALRAFGKVMHLSKDHYAGGSQVTDFVRWTRGGLDFTMATATFYCGSGPDAKGDVEYDWSGHYDLRTRRFTHIHVIDIITRASLEKELRQK